MIMQRNNTRPTYESVGAVDLCAFLDNHTNKLSRNNLREFFDNHIMMNSKSRELMNNKVKANPNGKNTLKFGENYLVYTKLCQRNNDIFTLTPYGEKFLKKHQNASLKELCYIVKIIFDQYNFSIHSKKYLRKSHKRVAAKPRVHKVSTINFTNKLDKQFAAYNDNLKRQLLREIMLQKPYFFEYLVVKLLSKMGYKGTNGIAKRTQSTRDGGIDGIIKKDALGTSTIYIQAKRYSNNDRVNINEIKNFYTSVKDRHSSRGVFITTSSFDRGAVLEAHKHSIILIDGDKLTHFMIEYKVGIQVQRIYTLANIDDNFFDKN